MRRPADPTETITSAALLGVALVAVVGLAKVESKSIEDAVEAAGFPQSFVGIVIACWFFPETLAALRAARRDRIQISLNLAFGSAIASIGLTIPVIAVASIWLEGLLVLGLGPTQMVLLAVTVVVAALTVASAGDPTTGRRAPHPAGSFIFLGIKPDHRGACRCPCH